jgi:hypothetical protein
MACAVVFLLPVVTPRGKGFLWSTFIVGAALVIVWAQHIYVASRPGYTESLGSSVGETLMIGVTALWVLGLAVRYVVWLFQLKREERLERQPPGTGSSRR